MTADNLAAHSVRDEATRAAEATAAAAGVRIRELAELGELEVVVDLYASIWGRSPKPPISLELMRAFAKAGNYVAGAYDGDRMVGACVGFFHAPDERALHSHIAGVAPGLGGRHVGLALKLHQRAWALQRDVAEIAWTFDPLVARNAHFNLNKLAARPAEYLTNFYGPMLDEINGEDDSDRLLLRWELTSPSVVAACTGGAAAPLVADELARGAVVVLEADPAGAPSPFPPAGQWHTALVGVPRDIELLRAADRVAAARWRHAVREALVGLLADGGRIDGFDKTGWYIVRRES